MQKIAYTTLMPTSTAERQARLFKALMHPVRLQILALLRGGEQCVCHLEAHLGQRQAYISQQLGLLRKAGLVADRRDGLNIFYHITCPELFALLDLARTITGEAGMNVAVVPSACLCPRCSPPRGTPDEMPAAKL